MKIIDAHTHCYPPEVAADPRKWATIQGESYWADLVAPCNRKSIQGWSTPEQMLHAMDAAGVAQSILLGWYWENETSCRWHNQVMADWIEKAPDRFIGFAAIHPGKTEENVVRQLEFAASLGLCGVGELHTGVQQFSVDSPGWKALSNWCSAHKWPVNFHVTEAAGHQHPGDKKTSLNEFIRMAEAAPELCMILAHWGGGLPFFELNPVLRKTLNNVYYDTAASPLLYEPGVFRRVVDLVGPQKIIFGSDYPLRIYPRKQKKPDFSIFLDEIRTESGLCPTELAAILHGNIAKILP